MSLTRTAALADLTCPAPGDEGLAVVCIDASLLLVNKPAGLLSVPDHPIRTAMPATATCASPRSAVYRRRQPERTLLYRTVQAHLATWLALPEDAAGSSAPAVTEREFRRTLECGILAHGFARARCVDCGHDFLIAYACKGRGVCPSCTTRRMVETAACRGHSETGSNLTT